MKGAGDDDDAVTLFFEWNVNMAPPIPCAGAGGAGRLDGVGKGGES